MSLTPQTLISTLSASSSGHDASAEQLLQSWETTPGYLSLLQQVYLDTSVGLPVRWLAVILFKNGVDRYWRLSRPNAVSKDEKSVIRLRLFDLLDEKNNQLVVQNAHSVAKIARHDFPAEWPTLVDDIDELLSRNQNNLVCTHNILTILNHVFKTISTVRVGRARHSLAQNAPKLIHRLVDIYTNTFTWVHSKDLRLMEICYLALKSLRRIIPESFSREAYLQDVLNMSVEHLRVLCGVYDGEFRDCSILVKYVRQYLKLYIALLGQHATYFILMPSCMEMVRTYLTLLEQRAEKVYTCGDEFWETLAVRGLIILKRVVQYIHKRGAITLKPDTDSAAVSAALSTLSTEVFAPTAVEQLCDLIIQWYLRLRPLDLELWSLDPEDWAAQEMAAASQWEFSVRACAENFFQDLVKYFPQMGGHVMARISAGMGADDPLIRDAVLCCFQLLSAALRSEVAFDTVFQDVLAPEALRDGSSELRLVKRRVCLITGEWCGEVKQQQPVFELLRSLMEPLLLNDMVVQLTAAQTLKTMVEDWDFDKRQFAPYADDFFRRILELLKEVEQVDTKMFLLQTLGVVIEKCNPLIEPPTLRAVLAAIPAYWEANEPILKGALVRVIRSLVILLNGLSSETHELALPLIASCCVENSENYAYSEDAYDLWVAIMVYWDGSEASPSLLSLFSLVPPALSNATEILPTILGICRSYALLCPEVFFGPDGMSLFETLAKYLPSMRDDAFDVLVTVLDVLLLAHPSASLQVMVASGFFAAMMDYVQAEHQSIPQQNKLLLVMSRAAYHDPNEFVVSVEHVGFDVSGFLAQWVDKFGKNGSPRNKKINLLGMIRVLVQRVRIDLALCLEALRLGCIFTEEVSESEGGECEVYNQGLPYDDIDDYCYLDENIAPHGEKKRYEALMARDPVHEVNLMAFLRTMVGVLREQLGDDVAQLCDDYVRERLE